MCVFVCVRVLLTPPTEPLRDADLLDLASFLRRAAAGSLTKAKLFMAGGDECRLRPLVRFATEHGWLRVVLRSLPDRTLLDAVEAESESDESDECETGDGVLMM